MDRMDPSLLQALEDKEAEGREAAGGSSSSSSSSSSTSTSSTSGSETWRDAVGEVQVLVVRPDRIEPAAFRPVLTRKRHAPPRPIRRQKAGRSHPPRRRSRSGAPL